MESITACLGTHGLAFDGAIDYQSHHSPRYEESLHRLYEQGDLFHCCCSRATLAPDGSCQSTCAKRTVDTTAATSLRVRVPTDTVITVRDRLLGQMVWPLGKYVRNFIVRRRDGLYAYQLAAAIDDAQPAVTQVVRGRDLLDSTPKQIFLQQKLGLESPVYAHLPVLTNPEGFKLSKQTGAPAVDATRPLDNLRSALQQLGQPSPPQDLASAGELLAWGQANWDHSRVTR